jgi:hypothetical protein
LAAVVAAALLGAAGVPPIRALDTLRDMRQPLATPRPTQPVDWPSVPDLDGLEPVAETDRFLVYLAQDSPLLARTARRWAPQLDAIGTLVQARLGLSDEPERVHVVFAPAYGGSCPARGLATQREIGDGSTRLVVPVIEVFVDRATSEDQIRAVIAHEVTHAYTFGPQFVGDGVLGEGVANWAPGGLVRRWQGVDSWAEETRLRLADGTYVSVADAGGLTPAPGEDCLERRDRVYNVRAAFTEWLVNRYGRGVVLAMPHYEVREAQEGSGEPVLRVLPDYRAATGFSLEELETIWLAELTGRL